MSDEAESLDFNDERLKPHGCLTFNLEIDYRMRRGRVHGNRWRKEFQNGLELLAVQLEEEESVSRQYTHIGAATLKVAVSKMPDVMGGKRWLH